MTKPILHHYPPSLFSEKVRALMGYLDVAWHSVMIPPIMPRPNLMPLSGGYRKTPIMQIGGHVYCDTAVICRALAQLQGDQTLYAPGFAAERVARWADTELFRITVALNFRPEAIAAQMSQMSSAELEAFQKDRAELSGGVPMATLDPVGAEAEFKGLMRGLDEQLAGSDYLFGTTPSIADFSVYHNLWFVEGNEANRALFEAWPAVRAYMQRIRSFGHGQVDEMSSEAALEVGQQADPVMAEEIGVDADLAGDLVAGQRVTVAADDYGRNAIAGQLLGWNTDEVVIERQDEIAGRIILHVPTVGFDVSAAS